MVAEACDGRALVHTVECYRPQMVITDVQMPGMNGIEATKIIQQHFSECSVLGLSVCEDRTTVLQLFAAGAKGYLLKGGDKEELLQAIQTVSQGETYYSQFTSSIIASLYRAQKIKGTKEARQTTLCEKKTIIIKLICHQLSTKEIATELRLSTRTIDDYRYKIFEKTGAKNMVGVALYAIKNGLVNSAELP